MANGILLEQPYPGATTCIVIGALDAVTGVNFGAYQQILWCTDAESGKRLPAGLSRAAVRTLLVGASPAELEAALDELVLRTPQRLPTVYVTAAVTRQHRDAYENIISTIHAVLESYHRARLTRQKDGFQWQHHVLQNLPHYIRHRLPREWKDALRGMPAFVCGAGPSLDVSAPVLARIADRGIVFSADSALKALAIREVQADFGVSVDVAKLPEKCLPPSHAPLRVVLSAVSPPTWSTAVPEASRFFLSSTQLTLDWLAAQGVPRTELAVAESCGTTALELARYLGCAPIYLFGLDLAADVNDPTKRHHADADATIYAKSGYDPTQRNPMVPGNYVERLPTFMFGDWRTLDARVATWPANLVFNVNDRGARIRNTTLVHPAQFALVESGTGSKVDALARLRSPAAPEGIPASIAEKLRAAGAATAKAQPRLEAALAQRGPAGLVAELRPLFQNDDFAQVMGAFSLKLIPHLLPPTEGDREFWQTLLTELNDLARLTQLAE
jgi:hypothetical protein